MELSLPVSVGDYAASIGTTGFDYTVVLANGSIIPPNGAFQAVTGVRLAEITDGLSNTLLVGEKHVPSGQDGLPPWDCGLWDGHNISCSSRAGGPGFALAVSADDGGWKFGSRHPGVCQFVYCDGSVRVLSKTTTAMNLGLLAQRNDGQVNRD
jgi:prepilin-type processing-associated H-X9-DG protein